MSADVKHYLYGWLGRQKCQPRYDICSYSSPWGQLRFKCKLRITGERSFPYIALGDSTTKKGAKTIAAYDFCRYAIDARRMDAREYEANGFDQTDPGIMDVKPVKRSSASYLPTQDDDSAASGLYQHPPDRKRKFSGETIELESPPSQYRRPSVPRITKLPSNRGNSESLEETSNRGFTDSPANRGSDFVGATQESATFSGPILDIRNSTNRQRPLDVPRARSALSVPRQDESRQQTAAHGFSDNAKNQRLTIARTTQASNVPRIVSVRSVPLAPSSHSQTTSGRLDGAQGAGSTAAQLMESARVSVSVDETRRTVPVVPFKKRFPKGIPVEKTSLAPATEKSSQMQVQKSVESDESDQCSNIFDIVSQRTGGPSHYEMAMAVLDEVGKEHEEKMREAHANKNCGDDDMAVTQEDKAPAELDESGNDETMNTEENDERDKEEASSILQKAVDALDLNHSHRLRIAVDTGNIDYGIPVIVDLFDNLEGQLFEALRKQEKEKEVERRLKERVQVLKMRRAYKEMNSVAARGEVGRVGNQDDEQPATCSSNSGSTNDAGAYQQTKSCGSRREKKERCSARKPVKQEIVE